MDSATEFLFGKSTNLLSPGEPNPKAKEFVDAYVFPFPCLPDKPQYLAASPKP